VLLLARTNAVGHYN